VSVGIRTMDPCLLLQVTTVLSGFGSTGRARENSSIMEE